MRTPRLAALELRKFGRGRLPRAAMVSLLLLPLLYGALYLWSFWDPYGRLDKIPVALVNADEGTTVDGRRLAAGDSIVDGLRESATFDWRETGAAEAAKGVQDGDYYLSLTIPRDFSARVASSSGDHPRTGALQVRTNDANNYIVGQISRTVFSEVRSAASTKASRNFYDRIFVAFSDLHDETAEAADGADDVTKGAGTARTGSKELGDGISSAEDGARRLAGGLHTAKQGSGSLAGGLGALDTGAGQVAVGTQSLADKVNGASDELTFVKQHVKEINAVARVVARGSQAARDGIDDLPGQAAQAVEDAEDAAAGIHDAYAEQCPLGAVTPQCRTLKKAVDAADDVADVARRLDTYVHGHSAALDGLRDDLGALHSAAVELSDPALATKLRNAVDGVNRLNDGAHKVAKGLRTASAGAGALDAGLRDLASGADTLAGGMYRLSDGSNRLTTGLTRLTDGSGRLADGLHDGASRIPDYDGRERTGRTEVMADPVRLAARSLHKAPNYGTGFAPYFIPLSLWVGAMVAYMLLQPLSRRAMAAGAPARRIAVAGWLPVAAIGVLQTLALMAVLHWAIGLQMVRPAGTIGFLVLVTACFAAVVQWLNARFGPAGRVLVLALLMLQLTSAGGTYPVQTSPGFFNAIHPFLPMTYVVEGLRHLITGGGLWPVWRAVLVLLAFTAGALALTAVSARRKQVWTMDRLHPELSL
ncbi:YhgE/Pip domain-containing protein [Actinacidiphila glaucinigra]|uniref:YhgE/Pip domain-containing protein n=1 Tax=Actinacidiphila glaucinigra TaxID=235986 RepID=UPI002DD8CF78|nr:YhgE/Pip domain-containing protein [Actinacidiphila glaucinigra]WSD62612.1 YhgE/Pip domain-containing protein [Actinacidiphila glaucinigra]